MKQFTCEMCGSTDLMKQDGVFVCQTCGCKYSVEEAKKMMIEGTVDVTGSTVKVDNTGMIDNYLNLATSAIDSGNNQEAETYANKIIELDPQNAMAWTVKGAAAGWQTTGGNNRFNEAIDCWKNAINFIKDEEALHVLDYIYNTGNDIANAIITMHCNNFVSYRSKDNALDIMHNMTYILSSIIDLNESGDLKKHSLSILQKISNLTEEGNNEEKINELTEQLNEIIEMRQKFIDWGEEIGQSFSQIINGAAVAGSNAADADFGPDKSDKSDYAYSNWIDEITCCISLENTAMTWTNQIDTIETIYKNVKILHENMISSCSYEFQAGAYVSGYFQSKSLTDDAKTLHKNAIKEAEKQKNKKISDIKKKAEEEKKERINKYWEEHSDEKIALEQEKKELLDEISTIRKECKSAVSSIENEIEPIKANFNAEISELSKIISDLTAEKNSLGIFKSKEKKALQEKINEFENRKREAEFERRTQIHEIEKKVKKAAAPFDNKITKLDKRVKEIDRELTKDR